MSLNVLFRVDDFPLTKPEESWRHNLPNFKRFDAVMEKHGVEYVLGVIPRHTTEEDIDYLSKNSRITIALHGVEHDERFPNEFREFQTEKEISSNISWERDRLVRGNKGKPIDVYIPPHNVIDQKTCRVLLRLGFKTVMTGPGTDPEVELYASGLGLNVLRSSPPYLYGRSDELYRDLHMKVIEMFGHHLETKQNVVLCLGLHWTWEINIGLENLDKYLSVIVPTLRSKP